MAMDIKFDDLHDLPDRWAQKSGDKNADSSADTTETTGCTTDESEGSHDAATTEASEEFERYKSQAGKKMRRSSCMAGMFSSTMNPNSTKTGAAIETDDCDSEVDLKKFVKFNMSGTKSYEDEIAMTEREWGQYYYESGDLERFRLEAQEAAKALFAKKQGFSRWLSTAVGGCEIDVADCILKAYSTCERAKTEKAMASAGNLIHREALEKIYSHHDLPGLEQYVLAPVRGEPEELRNVVLDCVQRSSTHRNSIQDEALGSVCECISRSSRLLAHEVAKAQHAALYPTDPLEKASPLKVAGSARGRRNSMF